MRLWTVKGAEVMGVLQPRATIRGDCARLLKSPRATLRTSEGSA